MKLGDKDMDGLSKVREDQRKEDELEKLIREMKKQSKKRQMEGNNDQPRGKRQMMEINCSNYEGSQEGLLFGKNISSYNENEETAIDEALILCEGIDCAIQMNKVVRMRIGQPAIVEMMERIVKKNRIVWMTLAVMKLTEMS